MTDENTMAEGKWLRLVKKGRWEYAERTNEGGAVVLVALTDAGEVVLVEQHRPAVGASVIELPAGLVGDEPEYVGESLETAAERELLEETGYAAEQMEWLCHGPPSAGLSSEHVTFFRASSLRKVAEGGGDETEDIRIHEVPLREVPIFLHDAQKRGAKIDPKVFAGLYFLGGGAAPHKAALSIELPIVEGPPRGESPVGLTSKDELFERLDELLPPLPESGRVGILGGTFNPPHVGHALLAHSMLATESIDELWVIPVFEHPFGKGSVGFEHRVAMCRRGFGLLRDRVHVCEIERELPKPSFTVQTLSTLHAVRPGIEPTLVIGSDIIPELPKWREPERLPQLSRVVVVRRQGAPEIQPPQDLDIKIHRGFRLPKVSSTAIREALRHDKGVEGLLVSDVIDYIREHSLYV